MNCPKCTERELRNSHEIFSFVTNEGERFVWDITKAKDVLSKRKTQGALVTMPPELYDIYLSMNEHNPEHFDHVDPSERGILATMADGTALLIDGTHRLGRCKRDNLPFTCEILWLVESIYCQAEAELHG